MTEADHSAHQADSKNPVVSLLLCNFRARKHTRKNHQGGQENSPWLGQWSCKTLSPTETWKGGDRLSSNCLMSYVNWGMVGMLGESRRTSSYEGGRLRRYASLKRRTGSPSGRGAPHKRDLGLHHWGQLGSTADDTAGHNSINPLSERPGQVYKENVRTSPSSQASGGCQEILQLTVNTGSKGVSEYKS